MLGVAPVSRAEIRPRPPATERTYLDTLRRLLPTLGAHDVRYVTVSFDGCGDSGSIQEIAYDPQEVAATVSTVTVAYQAVTTQWDEGQWRRVRQQVHSSMNEAIERLTYDYLEETDVDWYNDDGGFGELVIDVEGGTVSLDVNVRYTESHVGFSSEREIATGEEV
jgi:hypothetical protein